MNTKLSTLIYNLQSQNRTKVILFTENNDDSSNEVKLKKAIERLLEDVNIKIREYEVVKKEELSTNAVIRDVTKNYTEEGDLIIWSETETQQREGFLRLILKKESKNITSPIIMILKKQGDKEV